MIPLSTATLIGFVFETLLYGVFLVVFGISVNLQWGRYKQESLTFGSKLAFAFSILLCLFITTHWWLNLWGVCNAFLQTPTPMAREMFLADLGATTSIAKLAIYEVQAWMGDALLIYRLYHISGRRWALVVLPTLLWCALIVCCSGFLHYSSEFDLTKPQTLPATVSSINKWAIATFSITAAENIYCLTLIAFFMWRTHRNVRQAASSSLQSVLRILIDSVAIWVLFIFLTFIIYLSNENACYIVLYPSNPILGISSCAMIIRLQLRKKTTLVGSRHTRNPSYLTNFRATIKERGPYSPSYENAPGELTVFSSKRTVDDSTFDIVASKV